MLVVTPARCSAHSWVKVNFSSGRLPEVVGQVATYGLDQSGGATHADGCGRIFDREGAGVTLEHTDLETALVVNKNIGGATDGLSHEACVHHVQQVQRQVRGAQGSEPVKWTLVNRSSNWSTTNSKRSQV